MTSFYEYNGLGYYLAASTHSVLRPKVLYDFVAQGAWTREEAEDVARQHGCGPRSMLVPVVDAGHSTVWLVFKAITDQLS